MAIKTANVLARVKPDTAAFSAVMQRGLDEAKADHSRLAADVFAELRQEV